DDLVVGAQRVAVLEGLNDAENLGAIARAARAFDIEGLIIDATCTDPYSRRTVRVSMGEVLTLPIARAGADDWNEVADCLRTSDFEVWAMTPAEDADNIWDLAVPERLAVCLGAEGPGLSRTMLSGATHRVRIPISPTVDSLNVAQAAAVTFAATNRTK
ncbi:MAG TPA: RNA methyltransferase, partial [Ilumatobacteraceae bacterium]|nr:RNA methyltransferase [Ilumatobacteraceae bacterium]